MLMREVEPTVQKWPKWQQDRHLLASAASASCRPPMGDVVTYDSRTDRPGIFKPGREVKHMTRYA